MGGLAVSYTSGYEAPYIDSTGLHVPKYSDILDYLNEQYKTIFGQDVYLAPGEADYQFNSLLALMLNDAMQGLVLTYLNRAPSTATAGALDSLLKVNGLARKRASYSTCDVTLSGIAGTVVQNALVMDDAGVLWGLPTPVTIGPGGSVTVTATCVKLGAIEALAGAINTMAAGLTAGWTSVVNAAAATAGQPVEADSEFRARQAISTALPSKTMLAGTIAAIAALLGVVRYNIFENPTGAVDSFGTPAHSLTCVVDGGDQDEIAQVIYNNRGLGCYTNGDTPTTAGSTSVTVTDPTTGVTFDVGFYRPDYVPIYVDITVKAISGYTSETTDAIKQALVDYLNSLTIGEDVPASGLQASAMLVNEDITRPGFSITALTLDTTASPVSTADIAMLFYQVAQGVLANITVTVV